MKTTSSPSTSAFRTRGPLRAAEKGVVRLLVGALLCCALQLTPLAQGHGGGTVDVSKVEAAFLRNFAHYVTWPPHIAEGARWRVCVLGRDPFGDVLEATLKGRVEQGRRFEVFRGEGVEDLPECDIVFVALRDPARRRAVLAELRGKPVLTVGDAPDFLQEGGIVRFEVRDRVKMGINLDQARAASLTIQTKMLEVADHVLENGMVRKLR